MERDRERATHIHEAYLLPMAPASSVACFVNVWEETEGKRWGVGAHMQDVRIEGKHVALLIECRALLSVYGALLIVYRALLTEPVC